MFGENEIECRPGANPWGRGFSLTHVETAAAHDQGIQIGRSGSRRQPGCVAFNGSGLKATKTKSGMNAKLRTGLLPLLTDAFMAEIIVWRKQFQRHESGEEAVGSSG